MRPSGGFLIVACFICFQTVACQQIWDIWQTTWDRSKLFTSLKPNSPINFTNPGVSAQASINIEDTTTYQSIWGFGGGLTDSTALVLNNLKTKNPTNYWKLLNYLFSPTDGADAAGLSFVRVPLGASDFSAKSYSYDDTSGDTSFSKFDINRAPSYLFSVLKDIQSINDLLRVHLCPWSPPGWMKDSGTMNGGSLKASLVSCYATYLLKALQGFKQKGINVYSISIQNEPQNVNPSYPTTKMTPDVEAEIGIALRKLMDSNGFQNIKLIGFEHNWNSAASYPVQLMQQASSAFDGVAFHCYSGNVADQDKFHTKYPTKEIYMTECTGVFQTDWWSDIKGFINTLFIGSITHNAHAALMWNIALDGSGNPKLPSTTSCGGPGCRAIVTINSDGTYTVNQEFYAMAQASKAILPRDVGGPWGKRIGVSLGGDLGWALVVGAYTTGRASPNDWPRYSLVVLNWDDSVGGWNPQPVRTTINFRGKQAAYTFPVGITTLWWYAPNTTALGEDIYVELPSGMQERLGFH